MKAHNAFIVVALAASLALAGCVDSLREELETASADGDIGTLTVTLSVENAPADFAHLGVTMREVFVHDANTTAPDGFYEVNLSTGHADLIIDGEGKSVELASGEVPALTYDQLLLRLRQVENHATASGAGDHEHADGEGGDHQHDDGNGAMDGGTTGALDIPVNITFEVPPGSQVGIELVLDGTASTEGGDFRPVISRAVITQDGDVVDEITDVDVGVGSGGAPTDTTPPVARMAIFGPDGAKVYQADFLAESGAFANTKSSAFRLGDEIRFSATDSEAVEAGATLETYAWDFDDGATAEGLNVQHAWEQPGAFEVKLTVTDSEGATDSQVVVIVVLATEWTAELVNIDFEDGAEGWTSNASGAVVPGVLETTWALAPFGRNDSSTSYHVGTHFPTEPTVPDELGLLGYTPGAEATLTSPVFTVPANWSSAGFFLHVAGGSEAGFDVLTVSVVVGGESAPLGQFSGRALGPGMIGIGDWTEVGAMDALADAPGQEVQFVFTFTSDGALEVGPGWFVDDLVIGGVDLPLHKADLLERGAGDGHDHQH